ncbi:MAG: serine protease, partial [Pseudobdellovibrionaceae bacterium]
GLLSGGCAKQRKEVTLDTNETVGIIYGVDNRMQAVAASARLQTVAKSTVALVKKASIARDGAGRTILKSRSYKDTYRLCSSEPFVQEKIAAFCSGSLIAPNQVLTAGHCITQALDCADTRFVFDFKINSDGRQSDVVERNNLYSCKKIISHFYTDTGADFAVIELDRIVLGRTPVKLATRDDLRSGDEVIVMGHPSGLPLKIAPGGFVRSVQDQHFVANLDTYGGNSGSAVFNAKTLEVEGVLVRGDTDYVRNGLCLVSNRCAEGSCRGEDVTKISSVIAALAARR